MEILRLSALGGLLGLDGTTVGQFMASRPLVAGALTGWFVGDPALGLTIGAILELFLLVSFPTGGARFPEGATATVVAVASAVPSGGMHAVPLAVAVGLVWGQLGGLSISGLRRFNSRLVPESLTGPGDYGKLARVQLAAIGADGLRGFLVTFSGIVVGRAVVGSGAAHWPLSEGASMGILLAGGAVSAGILLHDAGGFRRRRAWFAAGLALGIIGTRFL
jgi:mannose/fructose/N-acetylgalactosamine-specific phosphotransferase system component IIC